MAERSAFLNVERVGKFMRKISSETIEEAVKELFVSANYALSDNAKACISAARERESAPLAKSILSKLEDNLDAAKELDIPICQDTGMAIVFAEIGNEVFIEGNDFTSAVNEGVRRAYTEGYMRCSVVGDPFYERKNTNNNTPAIIYTDIVKGDKIKITALPKGFGSENMSAIKMFTPSASEKDIINFAVDTVKKAGSNPCPPIMVGVGIGGTFDYSAVISKKALARDPGERNSDPRYAELEIKMLDEINKLNIGPQGFGGDTTALAVNIEKYPTHIAGLPVAVNICCHVMRHKTKII